MLRILFWVALGMFLMFKFPDMVTEQVGRAGTLVNSLVAKVSSASPGLHAGDKPMPVAEGAAPASTPLAGDSLRGQESQEDYRAPVERAAVRRAAWLALYRDIQNGQHKEGSR